MAFINIEQNKKGELQAKIQVSGKDFTTGKTKRFNKRVYNTDNLTEPKFRKLVSKLALEFEEEVATAYKTATEEKRFRVLTFSELMTEWKASIKSTLSVCYYVRATQVDELFTKFLEQHGLADKPISAITVRDVQMFLNSFTTYTKNNKITAKLKKDFPKQVNFRELARDGIITRCSSYNLRHKGTAILKERALQICQEYSLNYNEYFEELSNVCHYSTETVKGYRRILRTLFNEAVRYDWITKNPVCATKVGANGGNSSLRPVTEKEVFSFSEVKQFLKMLDTIPAENINKKIPIKFMLLTGLRIGEMLGLRWEDIDFNKKVVHVKRNRMYHKGFGIYEKEPKTKTSRRDVPLNDSLIADLIKYMDWFRLADKDFDKHLDKYYVTVNFAREPLFPHIAGTWLKAYEREWDMKEVTCHGLRHTYCSMLLSQNVPIQTVSKYMGHSDSTVTLKVYSHFIPDTQEKVICALNNITDD